MVAPLFGVELAHARERVEVVGLPTVNDAGAVGAVGFATMTVVLALAVLLKTSVVTAQSVVVPFGMPTVFHGTE
jgi:hypothetical protein